MAKTSISFSEHFALTMQRMRADGLLLVTAGSDGRPNIMTIGWGTVGSMWGRPCFLIMVRPSRYSHRLLEQSGDFTVNVAPAAMAETIAYCGKVSGRECDKFAQRHLTAVPARQVRAPIVGEAVIHYECRTLYRSDLAPDSLLPAIRDQAYQRGDYHRLYVGEILAAYADEDAAEQLTTQEGKPR
jgi:flavin reductase (DIM6/NTAB) family NADH-FMN oxidoreductase RutF